MERLKEKYTKEVVPALMEKFGYKNIMQVPKLEKIVLNMGVGEAVGNPKVLDSAVSDLTLIAGQKPILTRAKKSLAAFKLREGMPIGAKVTLRGERMYQFLDKFMNVALPRVRDFRGFSSKGDGSGNFTIGIQDQAIFVEAENLASAGGNKGFNITIVTTANSNDEGKKMLELMGFPFSSSRAAAN